MSTWLIFPSLVLRSVGGIIRHLQYLGIWGKVSCQGVLFWGILFTPNLAIESPPVFAIWLNQKPWGGQLLDCHKTGQTLESSSTPPFWTGYPSSFQRILQMELTRGLLLFKEEFLLHLCVSHCCWRPRNLGWPANPWGGRTYQKMTYHFSCNFLEFSLLQIPTFPPFPSSACVNELEGATSSNCSWDRPHGEGANTVIFFCIFVHFLIFC